MAGSNESKSSNQSYVDPVQQRYNADLYSKGQQLANSQSNFGDIAAEKMKPYLDTAKQSYNKIDAISNTNPLDGTVAQSTLQDLQQSGISPRLSAYYDAAMTDVNNNLQRNVLPSIQSGAVQAGQAGSTRQGIAEGLALSDANRQATQLAGELYGNAYEGDQARRMQSASAEGDLALRNTGQQLNSLANNIASASQMYNMELDPYAKQWDPLMRYKQLVGNAVVLGQGSSDSFGWNVL